MAGHAPTTWDMDQINLSFLSAVDWTKPDGRTDEGHRYFDLEIARDDLPPFTIQCRDAGTHQFGFKPAPEERQAGDDAQVDLEDADVVRGVSSSTSRDFFDTEMSLTALEMMRVQMQAGIPFVPRHRLGMFTAVEWDMIIGTTVDARVIHVDEVLNAFDPEEQQFLLETDSRLIPVDADADLSQLTDAEKLVFDLRKRILRGEVIGQSIGGWFTLLRFIHDDEDELIRVIILAVDLDHLALTRGPANPDANKVSLRARISAELSRLLSRPAGDLEERHIVSAKETEHTVVYQYIKSGSNGEDVEDDELVGGRIEGPGGPSETSAVDRSSHIPCDEKADCPDSENCVDGRCVEENSADDTDTDTDTEAEPENDTEAEPENGDDRATETDRPTHIQIEAECSLAVTREDDRIGISWDVDASDDDLRAAVQDLMSGVHGDDVRQALLTGLSGSSDKPDEPEAEENEDEEVELEEEELRALFQDAFALFNQPENTTDDLDNNPSTAQDESVDSPEFAAGTDALRSAPLDVNDDPASDQEAHDEEGEMPLTLDQIRDLFTTQLTPISDRLSALEGRSDTDPEVDATPEILVEATSEVDLLRRQAADADAARQRAEIELDNMLGRSNRMGVHSVDSDGSRITMDLSEIGGRLDYLVERSRHSGDGTTLCAVVSSNRDLLISEDKEGDSRESYRKLLAKGLNAAIRDGLLTEPTIARWN